MRYLILILLFAACAKEEMPVIVEPCCFKIVTVEEHPFVCIGQYVFLVFDTCMHEFAVSDCILNYGIPYLEDSLSVDENYMRNVFLCEL